MSRVACTLRWLSCATVSLLAFAAPARGEVITEPAAAQILTAPLRTERQYLSGTSRDDAVRWDFFCTANRNSGNWTTIPVPSCWDVQGFGSLRYYDDDAKLVAEQGKYRRTFTTSADWTGRRVQLVFDGVMTDAEVLINGKIAGPVHQGAFYRFKYDVTNLLRSDGEENLIEVTVSKRSANASVNRAERKADYWVFGGIFRPVYLEALPAEHIERVAIDARADGTFKLDAYGTVAEGAKAARVTISDGDGKSLETIEGKLSARSDGAVIRVEKQCAGVALWTAESPTLYTARVELLSSDGRTIHEVSRRFGFRTVEVRPGDGVYVNGHRVMLKGSCRHAFYPDSGRTLSPTIDRGDIELMKQMNMNAVRMSHYPPDESFLDLCDELGLYVIDELAGWQKSYDADIGARLVGEMLARDVNHPSILFWDNGNEGGWNTAVDGEFAKWDPQGRRVLHPWGLHDDVDTKHYPNFAMLTERLAGSHVFMPTEALHGLYDGGAGAGLHDYWKAMQASKVSAGAFIWAFADEGIIRTDDGGKMDVAGNGAPDGIVGPFREKEASFFTVKKIWSPVELPDVLPADFDGQLSVSNRYDFTSLDRVKFVWQLRRWRGLDDAESGHMVLAEGHAHASAIAPAASGTLVLDLPREWQTKAADALSITATGPDGREIWTWVYALSRPSLAGVAVEALVDKKPDVDRPDELRSGDVVMRVDAKTGVMQSVELGGKAIPFAGGPRLAIGTPQPVADRKGDRASAGSAAAVQNAPPRGGLERANWTAGRNGWFRLDYQLEATGPCDYLGVTFDLPEKGVESLRWLGAGPQRVWQNRMDGPTLGVWENRYNDTITGWSGWKYPEFKGYFADLHWATLKTADGTITLATETPGLFLRVLTPSLPPDGLARTAHGSFPDGGLSLMNIIPAIGSKFDAPTLTGPSGAPQEATGRYSATVWFRFARP